MNTSRRYIIISVIGLFILMLILFLSFKYNNIHAVIPGQVYRSSQLKPDIFKAVVEKYHIRSVINLEHPRESKNIPQEMTIASNNGIKYYLIPLSAKGLPDVNSFRILIKAIQEAPRPLLIHCRRGSDRTGLASALVLILDENASLNQANQQIAWWYGAVSLRSTGRLVMNMYANWLMEHDLPSNRANFLIWVQQLQLMGKPAHSKQQVMPN